MKEPKYEIGEVVNSVDGKVTIIGRDYREWRGKDDGSWLYHGQFFYFDPKTKKEVLSGRVNRYSESMLK